MAHVEPLPKRVERSSATIAKLESMLRDEPDRLVGVRKESLARNYFDRAFAYVLLNAPAATVINDFSAGLAQRIALLDHRAVHRDQLQASGGDVSLGNVQSAREALLLALALRDRATARRAARTMWDPERAPWVGTGKFSVYDAAEQRLAHAARELLIGDMQAAQREAKRVRCLREHTLFEADVIDALARKNRQQSIDALGALIASHATETYSGSICNRSPLCLPAIAWSAWAESEFRLVEHDLPNSPGASVFSGLGPLN